MAVIGLRGTTVNTIGALPPVGSKAPEFKLVDGKLNSRTLADYAGKRVLLYVVPSLDTPVCANSSKRFNELAAGHSDVSILVVSADLPFAQGRFCGAEKLKNITPLSMMRSRRFAKEYGVLMIDGPLAGLTARAVIALDEQGQVLYNELVTDLTHEPDYDAAFAALS